MPDSVAQSDTNPVPDGPWKALGFDTFDAYTADQKAKQEKLETQAAEKETMIQRQAQELGDLRKQFTEFKDSTKANGATAAAATGGDSNQDKKDQDEFDSKNLTQLQTLLSDAEKEEVETMFKGFDADQKKLVSGSDEARAEFLRQFLRKQDAAPDSFFGRSRTPAQRTEKSLSEMVQGLFEKRTQAAGSPDVEQKGIPGLGKTLEERVKAHEASVQESRSNPVIEGGDLLGSLKRQRESQAVK